MKYIYSTSQMSKLSLTLHTFSITGSVAGLFLTLLALLTIFPGKPMLNQSFIVSLNLWILFYFYFY